MDDVITNIKQVWYVDSKTINCEFHLPIEDNQILFRQIANTLVIRIRSLTSGLRFSALHLLDTSIIEASNVSGKGVDGNIGVGVMGISHSRYEEQNRTAIQQGIYGDAEGNYHELSIPLDTEQIPQDVKRQTKLYHLEFTVIKENEALEGFRSSIEFGYYGEGGFQILYRNFITAIPPQVIQFDSSLYLNLIIEEVSNIKILDMTAPRRLNELYINRKIHKYAPPEYQLPHDRSEIGHKSVQELRTHENISLKEALKFYRYVTVVGELGSGKTTLLRDFSIRIANGEFADFVTIPIYIELKQFLDSSEQSLLSYILWLLRVKYGISIEEMELIDTLNQQKFVLLLDGSDETLVGSTADEANRNYEKVANSINYFITRFSKVMIVLTSRKSGWRDRFPKFHTFELPEFDSQQIFEFIDNWFKPSADVHPPIATQLKHIVSEIPQIHELAGNPLLLVLLIITHNQRLALPIRRVTLYERGAEIMLENWDMERNVQRFHILSVLQKRHLLGQIAFFFHQRGETRFPRKILLVVISNILKIQNLDQLEPTRVLNEISSQNGLFQAEGVDTYRFAHLAFQEYFVADYFAHMSDSVRHRFLNRYRLQSFWQEVIHLVSGILDDSTQLIATILEPIGFARSENEGIALSDFLFHDFLILATRCLSSSVHVDMGLRVEIIDGLKNILLNSSYQLDWELTSKALVELHDSRVNNDLIDIAIDSEIRPIERRITIVESLGQSEDAQISQRLLELLLIGINEPSHPVPRIRAAVVQALANFETHSVVDNLIEIFKVETNTWIKAHIARTLSILGGRSALPLLQQTLLEVARSDDIRWGLGSALVEALWRLRDLTVVPILLELLLDTEVENEIRVLLGRSIGDLADRDIVEKIIELVANESLDWQTRWLLTEALERAETDISQRLFDLLEKVVDIRVKVGIAAAIAAKGHVATIPYLQQAIKDGSIPTDLNIKNFTATGYIWSRITRILSQFQHSQIVDQLLIKFGEFIEKEDGKIVGITTRNYSDSIQGVILASSPFKPVEIVRDILGIMRTRIDVHKVWKMLPYVTSKDSLPELLAELKMWHNNYLHVRDRVNIPLAKYTEFLPEMLPIIEALSGIEVQNEDVLAEFEEILVRLPDVQELDALVSHVRNRTYYGLYIVSQKLGMRVFLTGEDGGKIYNYHEN